MALAPHRPGRVLIALALSFVLICTSCSDGGGDDSRGADGTTSSAQRAGDRGGTGDASSSGAVGFEQHSGPVDDFYVVPDPLPEGEPGQLIRVMDVEEAATDSTRTVRVMYHSRDAVDRDRAVTGTITYPTTEAPEGGWPVISTAHGTAGLASRCAPSRGGAPAPGFGVEGVHVATDFIGLGPIGETHSYLSKLSEGRSVIDAVRAARLLPEANAGDRWLAAGHSQGGHGALSAHELGASYAPELELLGTISLSPAAVFDQVYGDADRLVTDIVTAMGLVGAASEHAEVDPAEYFAPEALEAAEVMADACLDDIITAFVQLGLPTLFDHDPRTTEPAASIIRASDVGRTAVDAPLFLVSGTADALVAIDRVRELFDRLCDAGQVTELLVVEGIDHGGIIGETAERTTAWLEARLAGEEPVDSCAEAA